MDLGYRPTPVPDGWVRVNYVSQCEDGRIFVIIGGVYEEHRWPEHLEGVPVIGQWVYVKGGEIRDTRL